MKIKMMISTRAAIASQRLHRRGFFCPESLASEIVSSGGIRRYPRDCLSFLKVQVR
jgi:hypothetical protein